ncbi:MAG: SsrA-binding protein SmpB [Verrucomicrobia bacterium]|nr:SsrA-binding protein SmpB [Verrucomicrobiota bacterium]
MAIKELVRNRRAYHDYEILETYETGIVLYGTEVKSLREGGGSLQEAYVRITEGQLWLVSASIAPYKYGNIMNHEERRLRKLLMHGKEIQRLKSWAQEKGQTLVPLLFYLKEGRVKLLIGRAKGKKQHEKRQAIKEKEVKRSIEREMRR